MAEVQDKGAGKGAPRPQPKARTSQHRVSIGSGYVSQGRRTMTVIVTKGLGGENGSFEVHSEDRIHNFKDQITKRWSVPRVCQRLLFENGSRMLNDDDKLSQVRPKEGDLHINLVVDTSQAINHITSPSLEHRMEAATAFSELALTSPSEYLPYLLQMIQDQTPMVRIQAARGLAAVAKNGDGEEGNAEYIGHLGVCMGFDFHDDLNDCTAATEAVAFLLSKGNEAAWALVRDLLQDADPNQRLEAVRVIAIGAFFYHDERSFVQFTRCASDQNVAMRQAAMALIPGAADRGDDRAVAALLGRISDEDADTKRLAVAGLGAVASAEDHRVVSALQELLTDSTCSCQDVALGAIAKVARRGDADVVAAVRTVVQNRQSPPSAVTTLARLASPNDGDAVAALQPRFDDSNWNVRGAAIASVFVVLEDLADARLLSALTTGIRDAHIEVRTLSLHLLAGAAKAGVEEALPLIGECITDESERVRSVVTEMLEVVNKARAGDTTAKRVVDGNLRRVFRQWNLTS